MRLPPETLVAALHVPREDKEVGLDVGVLQAGTLSWAVFGRNSPRIRSGTLTGVYVGASASLALGPGFGANVLIGGSRRSIVLQPLSVERAIGLDLAAGAAGPGFPLPALLSRLKREARIPSISLNRSVIRMRAYAVRLRRLPRIEFSVHTAVLCAQKALAHFVSRGAGGTIINCSSVHQVISKPGYLAYSISKGGMASFTRTLALEFAGRGIRVDAVGPGAIDTPINAA